MILVLATAVAAVLWVLLWGLDVKALDALMISLLILVLAATAHIVVPFLPGRRSRDDVTPDPAPFS